MPRSLFSSGRSALSAGVTRSVVLGFLGFALFAACSSDAPELQGGDDDIDSGFASSSGHVGNPDGSPSSSSSGNVPPGTCTTHFSYTPPSTQVVNIVRVTGEWNDFTTDGPAMTLQSDGSWQVDVALTPGSRYAYKLLVNGEFIFDPNAPLHKYVGTSDNSAVDVVDCHLPTFQTIDADRTRPDANQGHLSAHVKFVPGIDGVAADPASLKGTLRKDFVDTAVTPTYDAASSTLAFDLTGLADGKYTLLVDGSDTTGGVAKTVRLVFWIEAGAFEWQGAVIYMGMNDRVKNGDTSNDSAKLPDVDDRAQWLGGDLEGIRQLIASNYLDDLGVGAIWLTPYNQNPAEAFPGSGDHNVTGYHGYWPTRAREVDGRLGGADALKAVVKEAHAHGIRVMQDYVVNHVHQEHEYVAAHPDWYRTSCVCGTDGCDWTVRRLDCIFTPYLPDQNWTVEALSKQVEDDVKWWVSEFDLDGLRFDAVKHVEDLAMINVTHAVRSEFETSGQKLFMTGETAMGWSDCGTPGCIGNEENYGTISSYIGPHGLDGQFDFVLYAAAPLQVFAYESMSLYHADYWTNASQITYPAGSIMTPYIGSHDTARFVSYATYGSGDVPGRQWDDVATPPTNSTPYEHERLALAWLFSLPGAPLLYYGDEYGEWGGSDPNNRHMFRQDGALNANEQSTLAWTKKLGLARKQLTALRHGKYLLTPYQNDDVSVTVRRTDAGDTAVVLLARTAQTISVTLPVGAELPNGTVLHDYLGTGTVTVQGNAFSFTVPAHGAAYLAP